MNTTTTFSPEILVNLAAAQIERNVRVARLFADSASKAVTSQIERNAQVAVALAGETVTAVNTFSANGLVPAIPAAASSTPSAW